MSWLRIGFLGLFESPDTDVALEGSSESFEARAEANLLGGYRKKRGDLLFELLVDVGQKLLGRNRVLCISSGAGDAAGDSSPLHRGVVVALARLESVADSLSGLGVKLEGIDDIETGATLGHFLVDLSTVLLRAGVQAICLVAVLLEVGDVVEAELLEVFCEVIRDARADGVKVAEAKDGEVLGKVVPQIKHFRQHGVCHEIGATAIGDLSHDAIFAGVGQKATEISFLLGQ